jgi:carbohydrate-selective porin OprB
VVTAGVIVSLGASAGAEDSDMRSLLKGLQSRVEALEKKIADQDRTIKRQQEMLLQQRSTIDAVSQGAVRQDEGIKEQAAVLGKQDEKLDGMKCAVDKAAKGLEIQRVKFAEISDMVPERDKGHPGLSIQGFEFSGGATGVFQGTHNANAAARGKKEARNISATVDIMVFKKFCGWGAAFMHLEAGEGKGVDEDLLVLSPVNYDADNDTNVRLTELWYETYFLDKKITALAGKIDPSGFYDNCAFANDETRQFLSGMFRNNPALEFPVDNSVGVLFVTEPFTWLEISGGVFDGNADWNNITNNPFSIAQVNFKPKFLGRDGNYRLYIWNNDSYHTRLSKAADELNDPDNPDLLPWNKDTNWGMGLCFDQYLTDSIGMFARFGNADRRTSIVQYSWSTGFHVEGKKWGRDNDVLGLAIGQLIPGKDYRKAVAERNGRNEGHFEAYYRFVLNEFVEFGPDFQIVWNPYGCDAAEHDTISVYGFRAQVNF